MTSVELQVPARYEQQQAHIAHPTRRKYAGMVGALDEAVGNVSAALLATGLAPRAFLIFTTDNGAPFRHIGGEAMSNWPLRGGKGELWEVRPNWPGPERSRSPHRALRMGDAGRHVPCQRLIVSSIRHAHL